MNSLQFYDDHTDENEEPKEETQKMQPNFSVNEVEIEEVSIVVETQDVVTEEVGVATFKNSANDEGDNLPFIGGRSNPIKKDLNEIEKGEEECAHPSVVPEAEESLHAPNLVDRVRKLVDLNRETCEADMDFTASDGYVATTENDEVPSEADAKAMEDADEGTGTLTENDSVPLEADRKAMEDVDEGTGILQQTESDGKHALTSDAIANGHQTMDLDTLGVEVDDQQPPPKPAPVRAALNGGSAGQDPEEVPADLAEKEDIINKDAFEKQTEASEHVDTEKEGSALNLENVNDNDNDNDNAQAGNSSAPKENPNVEEGLESVSDPQQLFNDANLAQLKAQIHVMGILRKGSSPSDDLLKSACHTSFGGTPSATVAEDVGNAVIRNPSSSRKRKSHDNQTMPSGNDGIATDLMNAVKDNLHLSQSQDALHLDDTDRQLRSAQVSAYDAMATATSALAQSHLAWAQIRGEDHSEIGIAREAQIASVAATVAAAASVAKAAVEAAKAIANVSLKAFAQRGQVANGLPSASQSKRKSKSSLARNRKSCMLDSVVKAAGMGAEAATQAGTVLAFANPFMQAGEVNEAENEATRAGSRKRKPTPKKIATIAAPKKKATKKSEGHISASPKRTPLKVSKDGSKKNDVLAKREAAKADKPGGKAKSPKIHKHSSQPAPPAKSIVPDNDSVAARESKEFNEKSESIARGSIVEIMTEEVGLRGGWFSGKVLKMAKGQAFVVYDEILNDDGSELEDWFPFKASGDPAGPRRQVRPVHPYNSIREGGSKKRRRVSMGSQAWTPNDHVDAFIQDAWWEGIFVELNDIDESKATIYFPGENDTQIVKVWDLRPSLQWEDGKWVPWVNSSVIENERLTTQGKDGSSSSKVKKDKPIKANVPKLIAKAKNVKESPKKIEAPNHEVDVQDLSAKATKAKKSPKKTEDSRNKVDEYIHFRSTRQGNVQDLSTRASKAKKSSKNLEISINEVSEPSPSRSSRKRKGLELSSETKKGKEIPRVLEDPVIEPTPTRSTRSSLGGKKLDEITTARDSSGNKSTSKVLDKKSSGGKNTKVSNKASKKDITPVRATKKLDQIVDTVTTGKTRSESETTNVTMTKTREKFKTEEAAKKRTRRR